MSQSTPAADKSSGTELPSGPVHNYLGRDSNGDHHHYNRRTQTVTVISHTGSRTHTIDVSDLSQWVKHVDNCRGWDDLRFVDLTDFSPEVLR